jgi:hypothetical protein
MFKIRAAVLASLRDGKPSALTPDDAREVARYIDTLATLSDVPTLLKKLRDEIRLQHKNQRLRS